MWIVFLLTALFVYLAYKDGYYYDSQVLILLAAFFVVCLIVQLLKPKKQKKSKADKKAGNKSFKKIMLKMLDAIGGFFISNMWIVCFIAAFAVTYLPDHCFENISRKFFYIGIAVVFVIFYVIVFAFAGKMVKEENLENKKLEEERQKKEKEEKEKKRLEDRKLYFEGRPIIKTKQQQDIVDRERKNVVYESPLGSITVSEYNNLSPSEKFKYGKIEKYVHEPYSLYYYEEDKLSEYLDNLDGFNKAFRAIDNMNAFRLFDTPFGIYPIPAFIGSTPEEYKQAYECYNDWCHTHRAFFNGIIDEVTDKAEKWERAITYFSVFYPRYAGIIMLDYYYGGINYRMNYLDTRIAEHYEYLGDNVEFNFEEEYVGDISMAPIEYENFPQEGSVTAYNYAGKGNEMDRNFSFWGNDAAQKSYDQLQTNVAGPVDSFAYNEGGIIHVYKRKAVCSDPSVDDYLIDMETERDNLYECAEIFNKANEVRRKYVAGMSKGVQ